MWICLEGLDRTGKSTVAEIYKNKGFDIVHMEAPDKKYSQESYAGPTYFEDMMEFYMKYIGRDVVFDRSIYGELVWSKVYNRKCMLEDREIEQLREIELDNESEYVLMIDENVEAHWNRCVDNNEPLTQYQFTKANNIYGEIAVKYEFTKKQLSEYQPILPAESSADSDKSSAVQIKKEVDESAKNKTLRVQESLEQIKLRKANVINEVLAKKIIKKSGDVYQDLEQDIRDFLNSKLADLFNQQPNDKLNEDDIVILKEYCKVIKNKQRRIQ